MGNTDSASSFLRRIADDRKQALDDVGRTHRNLVAAKRDHETAVMKAHSLGVTNSAMARATHKSETAIRGYLKRRRIS